MRILFWSATFWPAIGGVEVLAARLLPALQERGHEFVVITPKPYSNVADHTYYNGIPVYRLPFQNRYAEKTIDYVLDIRRQILKFKQDFQPDLVHINAVSRGDFFHLATNNVNRVPSLVTLHGQWEKEIEPIVEHTLRDADWVAGCSAAILDQGRQLVPEIISHSSVIHNGFELPSLTPQPLPFDPPRILCLGRLVPEKGFDLAVTAFASINDRFPQARLIIAGNGPARSELEQQAAKEKINHAVKFIGWVAPQGIPALINDATLVLLPSRQDSFPLVALEAAGMARAVVASRVGGLPEVVMHEQTGLVVAPEHRRALARAITFLLDHPQTATRMGQAARRRVQEAFSWEQHVNAYDALYQKLIASRPGVLRAAVGPLC